MSSSWLHPPIFLLLLLISAAASSLLFLVPTRCHGRPDPTPTPWPHQFHAALFMNNSGGALQLVDLWYDWPNGRNLNAIRDQLSPSVLHDVEWDNGTSFFYTPGGGGGGGGSCRTLHFEVGILRPDWLEGASYLGRRRVDGFLCDGWEKADFIRYYEDVAAKRPVHWAFFNERSACSAVDVLERKPGFILMSYCDEFGQANGVKRGMKAHVMTFEVGAAALEDAEWQAPAYCFGEKGGEDAAKLAAASGNSGGYPVNGLGALKRSMSSTSL